MTTRPVTIGQTVLIRAPVLAVYQNCCQVGLPADQHGGTQLVTVPYDIVFNRDVDQAMEAARLMLERLEQLIQATMRAATEVHELGGKRLPNYSYSLLMPRAHDADPLGR